MKTSFATAEGCALVNTHNFQTH